MGWRAGGRAAAPVNLIAEHGVACTKHYPRRHAYKPEPCYTARKRMRHASGVRHAWVGRAVGPRNGYEAVQNDVEVAALEPIDVLGGVEHVPEESDGPAADQVEHRITSTNQHHISTESHPVDTQSARNPHPISMGTTLRGVQRTARVG